VFDGAVVAIEAASPPVAAYVAAAVKGCASALGPGRCVDAETVSDPPPRWHAVLRAFPEADPRVMHIEVERDGMPFGQRQLHFTARDAIDTRWSTAGAVVAAIISGELERGAGEGPPDGAVPAPESPPASVLSSPEPIDLVDEVHLAGLPLFQIEDSALEALASGSFEVYEGPPEFGLLLRAKWAMLGGPFLTTGVGGALTPTNPLIVQTDGFVGLGAPIDFSNRVGLDLGASFVAEWLWLEHEAMNGRTDRGNTFRAGGALDLDVRMRIQGCWAALLGFRATALWPEVDVRRARGTAERQIAIVLPAGLGMTLGVRYDLGDDCTR
jgi:hypothetical protein